VAVAVVVVVVVVVVVGSGVAAHSSSFSNTNPGPESCGLVAISGSKMSITISLHDCPDMDGIPHTV
jgi:hypothetical protein